MDVINTCVNDLGRKHISIVAGSMLPHSVPITKSYAGEKWRVRRSEMSENLRDDVCLMRLKMLAMS